MSVMDDMLAWLDETLTHVERTAHGVIDTAEWVARDNEVLEVVGVAGPPDQVCRATDELDAAHIALHDPRAVLARVAAERAILAAIASSTAQYPDYDGGHVGGLEDAAMLIAWGHRHDAPGFLDEWAPCDAWTVAP